LLVRKDSIPAPTQNALDDLNLEFRTVAGGPNTVSEDVLAQLDAGAPHAHRVWGRDRYETAAEVMTTYTDDALWPPLHAENVGVTAKPPDALTGGSFLGLRKGCLVLTRSDSLPLCSSCFLGAHPATTQRAYVFGGPNSVEQDAVDDTNDALLP